MRPHQGAFPYRGVLWDIDGTLADSEPVHETSFREACAALGLTLPQDFHALILGKSDSETHAWLVEFCGLTLDLGDWLQRRVACYLDHIDKVTPHAEAMDLWSSLAARGVAQATVSNSDRMIVQHNLARLGLVRPGSVSVTRNDVREGKPSPESYLRAAHLLGLSPGDCAVVEDSDTGRRAAEAAGMTAYMMPWYAPGPDATPHRDVSALTALAAAR